MSYRIAPPRTILRDASKRTLGIITLFGAVLALGIILPSAMQAQADAEAMVSARVLGELNVFKERDLNFGAVLVGSGPINVDWADENSAIFTLEGQRHRTGQGGGGGGGPVDVHIEITGWPDELEIPNTNHTIPYALAAWYSNDAECRDDENPSTLGEGGVVIRLDCGLDGQGAGSRGGAIVWVGGEITVSEAAEQGDYEATIVLTATYD